MKKKIMAAVLLTTFLLTGCGAANDKVLEKANSMDTSFLDSERTINAALVKPQKDYEYVNSATMKVQVKKLVDVMDKNRNGDPATEGISSLRQWVREKSFFSLPQDFETSFYQNLSFRKTNCQEQLDDFLTQLENIGYTDLKGKTPAEYNRASFVRNNIAFSVYFYDADEEGGPTEIVASVSTPAYRLSYPKSYQDVIETTITDGFYLRELRTGGAMDRMTLASSWNEPGNPYNKKVDWYFQNNSPLQLEVTFEENTKKAEGLVFSAHEKQTMINMITRMTGDGDAATKFVSNFRTDGDSSGNIGKFTWELINDGRGKYILRIQ